MFDNESTRQAFLYDTRVWPATQNFETFLVSLKVQKEKFSTPLFAFNYTWTEVFAEDTPYLQVFTLNSSETTLNSGLSNGVEAILDLEVFDAGDKEETSSGLGVLIDNKDDYPLMNLNGFFVEPGTLAEIKISPELFTITENALDKFTYKERKCVKTGEIQLDSSFQAYSLANCLVAAANAEILEHCKIKTFEGDINVTGKLLGCYRRHLRQVGRWKIEKSSGVQCFHSCNRYKNHYPSMYDFFYQASQSTLCIYKAVSKHDVFKDTGVYENH